MKRRGFFFTSQSLLQQKSHQTIPSRKAYVRLNLCSSTSTSPKHTSDPISITEDGITKDAVPLPTKGYMQVFSELSKAKLSALVVSTSTFGFLAATSATAPISFPTLAALSIGTALCSSSASALNQIFERDRDALMKRTAQRPLVTQNHVNTSHAWAMALATGTGGTMTLYLGTDPITTALGLGNILLYSGLYTFLKPRSAWNTWVGAVVGAVPPIMGYTAATAGAGIFDIEAILLGSTLFLWQFPHFFALSWMHRVDYSRGGFQMIATTDTPHGDNTSRMITKYTWYLSAIPFITSAAGVTSSMFAIEGVALNGYALYVAHRFNKERSNGNARKVFLTSLWYLPCWMILFLLHSNTWRDASGVGQITDDDMFKAWIRYLQEKTAEIRSSGRQLCLHEMAVNRNDAANDSDSSPKSIESQDKQLEASGCPVTLGKSKIQQAADTIHAGASVSPPLVNATER